MDPQLIEVTAVVQALLEYTPTFGPDVIVPEEDMLCVTVMAAIVVSATASAATVRRITVNFEALAIAILFYPLSDVCILRLNKYYCEVLRLVCLLFINTH
jgi:hypothetical protein